MKQITLINNAPLSVKEYNGQRVVTFKDIDMLHQRADGTARRNFNTNKKHFIEQVDFFRVQPSEIRTVGIASNNGGVVVTESGYLMLVKSFTDDLAWAVQRELVNSYFKGKITPAPKCFLEECGVYKYEETKQTEEDIAKTFIQSLVYALNSGEYYIAPKRKKRSPAENRTLLGIYDSEKITLILSVAYSIYANFVGIPFNVLSISHHITPQLVRSGLVISKTKQRMNGKNCHTLHISIPQANTLRGYTNTLLLNSPIVL